MTKQSMLLPGLPPAAGPYAHAVRAGGFVFLAGQGPIDPDTGEQPEGFEEQALLTFRNLEAAARGAGSSLADAVRIGVYLRDMDDFAAMNAAYAEFVPEPFPVRTTIQSQMTISIEVDAVLWAPASTQDQQ
jgi:reactive intermediate/imine deaminase